MIIVYIFILVFGVAIGSFLNVCIYRIPLNESISFPPSHCTNCMTKLKWYDLFPVISYIILKGKCRYCNEKISIKYPVIELFTGMLFLWIFILYGPSILFLKYTALSCFLIVIGLIDLNTTDVYFKTTASGVIFGFLFILLALYFKEYTLRGAVTYIYGMALGGGFITLIILTTHGMGWGDVEICALCGLYLGFKLTVVMLFFSFIFGGILGGLLILLRKKSRKDYIPFGPFIALGTLFTIFYGERIVLWYLQMLC